MRESESPYNSNEETMDMSYTYTPAYTTALSIKDGDRVTIKAQGITVTGTVINAEHYDQSGWYIDMVDANTSGGVSSYRQRDDGGQVVAINGKAV
jgi:pyruvate/2-oxoglutarate/acetoin dehydrogenase E1 component